MKCYVNFRYGCLYVGTIRTFIYEVISIAESVIFPLGYAQHIICIPHTVYTQKVFQVFLIDSVV